MKAMVNNNNNNNNNKHNNNSNNKHNNNSRKKNNKPVAKNAKVKRVSQKNANQSSRSEKRFFGNNKNNWSTKRSKQKKKRWRKHQKQKQNKVINKDNFFSCIKHDTDDECSEF